MHEVLHREEVLALCQGKGLELGPGPRPQVLPSHQVDVNYIEQSAPEDWERLYNDTGNYQVDPKLWSRYQIGEACDLPVAHNSLDFIFSSHVFEHLANPLGHLKHWGTKLKANGKVLCVVPDLAGCKDYVYRPSPMREILDEQASGDMEPTLEHYARWAKYRRPGKDPEEFYKAKRSIHVHYYTDWNIKEVLQYAVENLGYAWFDIRYVPNHKDFYFVLSK
ncbi:MAG: methyltransferase domain-containing protein [Phormidesmis sp.]